jgi:hypothetical protein
VAIVGLVAGFDFYEWYRIASRSKHRALYRQFQVTALLRLNHGIVDKRRSDTCNDFSIVPNEMVNNVCQGGGGEA